MDNSCFSYTRVFLVALMVLGAKTLNAQQAVVYKTIDSTSLNMTIYEPPQMEKNKDKKYVAIIFFFGGGWRKGQPSQFIPQATYFAKKGFVCFLPDYRVEERNHTSPIEALKDAKSAIRFIKENAGKFNIDSSRIIASGGSAGGQLAAAAVIENNYNESTDNLSVSPKPHALVLFNPVIDNGPDGFGYSILGPEYVHFSPLHNIKKGTPPTLLMFGTRDKHVPVPTAQKYKMEMEKAGNRCDLVLYENATHGFFNFNKNNDNPYYQRTLDEAEKFLRSLGY